MARNLILLRGHPGAGKTTFAVLIAPAFNFSADQYFMVDGEYKYDATRIKQAHDNCLLRTSVAMADNAGIIAVHNTFISNKFMQPYFDVAKAYGYQVTVLHVEGDHGTVHDVPRKTIDSMKQRYQPYV